MFVLAIAAVLGAALFLASMNRVAFPYLLVAVLGLEYFSPGGADSVFTIPKVGFAVLVLSQVLTHRFSLKVSRRGLLVTIAPFVLFMGASVVWSTNPELSTVRSVSLVLLMIAYMVVLGSVRSRVELKHYLAAFVTYSIANAAMAGYQLSTGFRTYESDLGVRAGGLAVNPSEGAFYMGVGLIIMLAVHVSDYSKRRRTVAIGRLVLIGVLVAGVLATASRGGILALMASVAIVLWLRDTHGSRARLPWLRYAPILALTVVAVLAFPSAGELLAERLSRSGEDRWGNRLVIWSAMWPLILHRPLLGQGVRSTAIPTAGPYGYTYTYSSHNTPYGVLLDGGIVGLVLFALVAGRVLSVVRDLRRHPNVDFRRYGQILTGIVVLAAVFMQTHDILFHKLLWVLVAVTEGAWMLARKAPRQSPVGVEDLPEYGTPARSTKTAAP